MADRLQELLQQRALIKEHLEWLDAEIAASSGRPRETIPRPGNIPLAPFSPARPAPLPIVAPVTVPPDPDEAEALIAKLAAEEKTAPVPSKQGCWVLFCSILGVIAVGVWLAIYYFYRE